MTVRVAGGDDYERAVARFLVEHGWTVHEPGHSCIDRHAAFDGKRDTSVKAAKNVYGKTGKMRRAVYEYLNDNGPHADAELFSALDMKPNSCRPRRVELVDFGVVRDSGARKRISGEDCILWEVVRYGVVISDEGEALS